MTQTARRLEKEILKKVSLNYLLHIPDGYENDATKKWPLILFLHGSGERGDNVERVAVHGIPKIAQTQTDFPFIAVSPQCPEDSFWGAETDALILLLDEIVKSYNVDTSRVYLTGLSMGGYGAWQLAAVQPGRFAAIVPICGGGNPERVEPLKETPVWVFHGAKDDVVPLSESEKMVDALQAIGGNVKLTVYPEADHDSWTETYENPELYEWLLQHAL
ncbi:prolyl oligopeptidase family serine peptidase [Paenibacillus lycopersici]|uniref:Prolyl oligopeptidase family serine peptidase n=1 Tax=Paenibacillus lycopersici TaxID=2704462 RepID=A0A6C0G096_9BACL|nr:prolyl oligopeptidase family serine peptidase [Paenibacillus lycopersici]QHT61161.1 prolyl oligopeptidase family serine peptidase [Paenibacillus lycopersici]